MAGNREEAQTMITVVDPAAEIETENRSIAPRLTSFAGARIGFIDNTKHNANVFLEATRSLLQSRYQIGAVEYYRKFSASVPTPPEVIEQMLKSCDAVIHGVAD